jgi:hypothetical protein
MTRTGEKGTAPGRAPGAVSCHEVADLLLSEREFWRAVAASLLATLRPWPR